MARIARRIAGIGASDLPDAAAFDAYVGPAREITVDQQRGIIALHDGVTPGGQQFHAGGGGDGDTAIDPIPKSFAGIAGTNQTYTLDLVPATAGNVLVYVGGIRQVPGVDYTISGATLTILDNPDGLEVDTLLLAGPYSLTFIQNGSVTEDKLSPEVVEKLNSVPEDNLPPITVADAGKALIVNADGTGYEVGVSRAYASTVAEAKALTGLAIGAYVYLTEEHREGTFILRAGDFTSQLAADGFDAVYIKLDNTPITEACLVRKMKDGLFHMDWAGARTASDIKPIFDSMKLLAAGATLCFGAATYVTSDTLAYEAANNKPVTIRGVSETETIIQNEGTGFTFEYYGVTGSANEVRGGGISHMKLEKSGAGTCSGVDIANAYRANFHHIDTDACGNIGIRINGRGAGDQDATAGTRIYQNRCRSGIIGIQIRGEESGSIVAAEITIENNNLDGNATAGLWLANCDKVNWSNNTITACGHGAGGTVNSRGGFFVEYNGITPKNLKSSFNEYGNSYGDGLYIGVVESVNGFTLESDRWIRNNPDVSTIGVLFGLTSQVAVISNVRFEKPFMNAGSDTDPFAFVSFSGSNKTYGSLIVVEDPVLNEWNTAYHSLSADTTKTVVTRYGKDIRDTNARGSVASSGAINISTNNTLYHAIENNAGTATTLTVSGEKHEGDILTVEVTHTGAGTLVLTLGSGFTGANASIGSLARQSAQFRYSIQADTWRQTSPWTTM